MKVKLRSETAKAPVRKPDSIGYDLHSNVTGAIPAHSTSVIPLGISVEFESDLGAFIWGRSGIAGQGIQPLGFLLEDGALLKLGGCIEGTYRGEWKVVLSNLSDKPYNISVGDRIAQFVLQPVVVEDVEVVDELSTSIRGENGFGSTGK